MRKYIACLKIIDQIIIGLNASLKQHKYQNTYLRRGKCMHMDALFSKRIVFTQSFLKYKCL